MKNLKTINGKSLIEIVSNCIENCKYIDNSVLSSDNEEILNEGKSLVYILNLKDLKTCLVIGFQMYQF